MTPNRHIKQIGKKIWEAQLADAHDPEEYAEITIEYMVKLAIKKTDISEVERQVILRFLESIIKPKGASPS